MTDQDKAAHTRILKEAIEPMHERMARAMGEATEFRPEVQEKVLYGLHDRRLFFCPGCRFGHAIPVSGVNAWKFNGNEEAPTFHPSILVIGDGMARCHSYVTDGNIQFLADSTHALAGQTVPLPKF